MQMYRKQGQGSSKPTKAEHSVTDAMISKYDFNLPEYYKALYQCSKVSEPR